MTNDVCICGKSQKNKPIVITVTACKNRHICKANNAQTKNDSNKSSKLIVTHEPSTKTTSAEPIRAVEESISEVNVEHVYYDTRSNEVVHEEIYEKRVVITEEDKTISLITNESVTQKPTKDASVNVPSTTTLQLPILCPRYHGPDCALEICVLEKHVVDCDYKKIKNEGRNPVDDRIGSYEVIGRLKYKTCTANSEQSKSHATLKDSSKLETREYVVPPNDQVVMFAFPGSNLTYSLSLMESNKVPEENALEEKVYSKSSELMKCFKPPDKNHFKKIDVCIQNTDQKNSKMAGNQCKVEELYFYGKACNRCTQIGKPIKKKWYHYLCPCIKVKKKPKCDC